MRKMLCAAGFAAALLAGTSITPQVVGAQDFELHIGPNGIEPRFHDRDRDRWERRGYERRLGCDADEAESIARNYGLHRPRITRMTSRSVTVEGWTRDGRTRMRFANESGCPVI